MSAARKVTDHDEIRTWVEDHDGRPAKVDTGGDGGILRVDFREKDDNLTEIEWDEFFEIFDESKLAALIQEDDAESRFIKFVER